MEDQAATWAGRAPADVRLDGRLFATLPVAICSVQLVFGGIDLLLATALDHVEPGTAVTTYGWISGMAWLCALVAYPLVGIASDRTPPRFRRRTSWVIVGALGSAIGLAAMGAAGRVVELGAGYAVAFGLLPMMLVPLYASIPDRIAPSRRGAIGAMVGAATIAGGVAGNLLAARLAGQIGLAAALFGVALLVGAFVFAWLGGESRASQAQPSAGSTAAAVADLQRRRDFAWFAVGRFALFLTYAVITALAYYILRDHVGVANPAEGVAGFAVASGVTTLLASLVAGPWSDRLAQRRPFVAGSAALIGLGSLVPLVSPTLAGFLVAGAVIGTGFGTYLAVGTALGTLLLPSAATSARDLGFMAMANASAQAIAPVAGAYLATELGYPLLFAAAAGACVVAVCATAPIRSVR